jgi:hypothetical protein
MHHDGHEDDQRRDGEGDPDERAGQRESPIG